jgi:hypothetical protein
MWELMSLFCKKKAVAARIATVARTTAAEKALNLVRILI